MGSQLRTDSLQPKAFSLTNDNEYQTQAFELQA